jgi:hypothetical protein
MVDLEDAKAIDELTPPMRKRVQAGTENHVLPHPASNGVLDEVLREPRSDTHPPDEGAEMPARNLSAQSLKQASAFTSGQPHGQVIDKDRRPRVFAA